MRYAQQITLIGILEATAIKNRMGKKMANRYIG
jgi:hypothetical protein